MSQFVILLFSIANFVILVALLRKFLRQPVGHFFATRSETTHQYIEAAHMKRAQAEAELQRLHMRQKNLGQEISELKRHLEQVSQHERELIVKRAGDQAERLSREAKLQVEQDRLRVQQTLRHKILEQTFSQVEAELQKNAAHENTSVDASLSFLHRQLKEPQAQVGGNA